MNFCRDTPAKRWSAEFRQQRQMADDEFLVRVAHRVDEIDPLTLFLQDQEQTAFSQCKFDADTVERSSDVKSNARSTTTSHVTNVWHIRTNESPQYSNKSQTSKTARGSPKNATSADNFSNNDGSFYAEWVLIPSHKRNHITLEKNPVCIGAYAHDGYRDGLRSSYRTATLMCNLIAAVGASFYESPMNDSQCSMPRDTQEDSRISYVTTSLGTVQCLGLHALSLLVFGVATAQIHHSNRHHRYQDCFILGGVITGMIVGMYVHQDLQDTILKVVPWAILTSLLTSMVIHEAWGLRAKSFRLNDHTV